MKTKTWIILLSVIMAICICLSIWLLQPGADASSVRIISRGKVLHTLSLAEDTQLEIATQTGRNVVTIRDGKVAVTEANCPDGYCMARGWCSGGTQIVCLPNGLVLEFVGQTNVDGVAG